MGVSRKTEAPGARAQDEAHHGAILDRINGFSVIACRACGYAHVIPLPDEAAIEKLYASAYYAETKPDYLARAREDVPWARTGFDDRLDLLEAHLPAARRRLLDVGSGPGFFAARARERGWEAEGVDPSAQACAHARSLGVPVHEGPYDAAAAQALGSFDAVTLTNMLEHVGDPISLLARARKMLSTAGLLCISVPNDYNSFQHVLRVGGMRAWWLAPPHHLNYFTFDSLSKLLARAGFREIARTTSFPMEMFALMGDLYMDDDQLGRACHMRRVSFDLALAHAEGGLARRSFYSALAAAGLGREAIIIAAQA